MKKLLTILLVLGFSQKIASQSQMFSSITNSVNSGIASVASSLNTDNINSTVSNAATTVSKALSESTADSTADIATAANDALDPAYWDTVSLTNDQVTEIVNVLLDDGTDESDEPSRYNLASFLQDSFFSTTEDALSSNLTGFFQGLSSDDLSKFLGDDFTTIKEMVNNSDMVRYTSFLWAFYQSLTTDQKALVNNMLTAITNPTATTIAKATTAIATTVADTIADSTSEAGVFFDGMEMDDESSQQQMAIDAINGIINQAAKSST